MTSSVLVWCIYLSLSVCVLANFIFACNYGMTIPMVNHCQNDVFVGHIEIGCPVTEDDSAVRMACFLNSFLEI